jgi:uncharacterized protein YqeY
MSLKDRIANDFKSSMLAGDKFASNTLSTLKASILNEEISSGKRETGLADSEIESVVAREIKKRHESIDLYKSAGRDELALDEQNEIDLINKYLPEQISQEDLEKEVRDGVEKYESDKNSFGLIMKDLKAKLGSKVDSARLVKTIKEKIK